jgi:hypothetical protein
MFQFPSKVYNGHIDCDIEKKKLLSQHRSLEERFHNVVLLF